MIPKAPFGRTGHQSTRAIFGAAALSDVTQAEADRTMELLRVYDSLENPAWRLVSSPSILARIGPACQSSSAKWQAAIWPGATSRKGGASRWQIGSARGHRV